MATGALADQLHQHVIGLKRYAVVLTRNKDEAEDLVQETLVRAIAASDTWKPGSDLRVWLFRILHNAYVSDRRKQKVRNEARLDLPEPSAEADPAARLEALQVLDALQNLPEHQRRPIVLVALEDMNYGDAAKALGVPLGTFMSRLGRGREALRLMMNGLKKKPQLRVV